MSQGMQDVLSRLLRALPDVAEWIVNLQRQHAALATPVAELGFGRIDALLPRVLLTRARAVAVDQVPFPPVSELGLPEFETMASMAKSGITFGDMYFVHREHWQDAIHFHELAHVVQWGALGIDEFLCTYALEIIQHGYDGSPLEGIASELQRRFEMRDELPEDVVDFVSWHARQQHAAASRVFDSFGLSANRRTSG